MITGPDMWTLMFILLFRRCMWLELSLVISFSPSLYSNPHHFPQVCKPLASPVCHQYPQGDCIQSHTREMRLKDSKSETGVIKARTWTWGKSWGESDKIATVVQSHTWTNRSWRCWWGVSLSGKRQGTIMRGFGDHEKWCHFTLYFNLE